MYEFNIDWQIFMSKSELWKAIVMKETEKMRKMCEN